MKHVQERAVEEHRQRLAAEKEVERLQAELKEKTEGWEAAEAGFRERIAKKNELIRSRGKQVRKALKQRDNAEDRCVSVGVESVLKKAHSIGIDYKLLMEAWDDDPIERQGDLPPPPEVDSGEEDLVLSD